MYCITSYITHHTSYILHPYFYLDALPSVDGGLEAGAVDDGLGDGQFFDFYVHHLLFNRRNGHFVHLCADVLRVVPLAAIGQDGVNGQQVGDVDA